METMVSSELTLTPNPNPTNSTVFLLCLSEMIIFSLLVCTFMQSLLKNLPFWLRGLISLMRLFAEASVSRRASGRRRTACLNVTPIWSVKGSILGVSNLELAVMCCHYSGKAGHGCRSTVQNVTVAEPKYFWTSLKAASSDKSSPFLNLHQGDKNHT